MNHPITELAAAAFILCAALGTMFAVQPMPKPEPASQTEAEQLAECAKHPDQMCFVKVEPEPPRAQEQRTVDKLAKDMRQAERELKEVKEAIRLKQAVEALPEE